MTINIDSFKAVLGISQSAAPAENPGVEQEQVDRIRRAITVEPNGVRDFDAIQNGIYVRSQLLERFREVFGENSSNVQRAEKLLFGIAVGGGLGTDVVTKKLEERVVRQLVKELEIGRAADDVINKMYTTKEDEPSCFSLGLNLCKNVCEIFEKESDPKNVQGNGDERQKVLKHIATGVDRRLSSLVSFFNVYGELSPKDGSRLELLAELEKGVKFLGEAFSKSEFSMRESLETFVEGLRSLKDQYCHDLNALRAAGKLRVNTIPGDIVSAAERMLETISDELAGWRDIGIIREKLADVKEFGEDEFVTTLKDMSDPSYIYKKSEGTGMSDLTGFERVQRLKEVSGAKVFLSDLQTKYGEYREELKSHVEQAVADEKADIQKSCSEFKDTLLPAEVENQFVEDQIGKSELNILLYGKKTWNMREGTGKVPLPDKQIIRDAYYAKVAHQARIKVLNDLEDLVTSNKEKLASGVQDQENKLTGLKDELEKQRKEQEELETLGKRISQIDTEIGKNLETKSALTFDLDDFASARESYYVKEESRLANQIDRQKKKVEVCRRQVKVQEDSEAVAQKQFQEASQNVRTAEKALAGDVKKVLTKFVKGIFQSEKEKPKTEEQKRLENAKATLKGVTEAYSREKDELLHAKESLEREEKEFRGLLKQQLDLKEKKVKFQQLTKVEASIVKLNAEKESIKKKINGRGQGTSMKELSDRIAALEKEVKDQKANVKVWSEKAYAFLKQVKDAVDTDAEISLEKLSESLTETKKSLELPQDLTTVQFPKKGEDIIKFEVKLRFDLTTDDGQRAMAKNRLLRMRPSLRRRISNADIDAGKKDWLLRQFDAAFGDGKIPEVFLNAGQDYLRQIGEAEDANTVDSKLRRCFGETLDCMIYVAKSQEGDLSAKSGLPDITQDVRGALVEERRIQYLRDQSPSALKGAPAAIQTCLSLVKATKVFTDDEKSSLSRELDVSLRLLGKSSDAAAYSSDAFNTAYLNQFAELLKANGNREQTRLQELMEDFSDRSLDVSDDEEMGNLRRTVKKFAEAVRELAGKATEAARNEVVGKMDDKTKVLLERLPKLPSTKGLTTLDAQKLQNYFKLEMGLVGEDGVYEKMAKDDVEIALDILGLKGFLLPKFKALLTQVAQGTFPKQLYRKGKELMLGLLQARLDEDNRRGGVSGGGTDVFSSPGFNGGFGTYDGAAILSDLAKDGLLDVNWKVSAAESVQILSMLYRLNDGRSVGLPQAALRFFGKAIGDVTLADCQALDGKVKDQSSGGPSLLQTRKAVQRMDPHARLGQKGGQLVGLLTGCSSFDDASTRPSYQKVIAPCIQALRSLGAETEAKGRAASLDGVTVTVRRTKSGFTEVTIPTVNSKDKDPAYPDVQLIQQSPESLADDLLMIVMRSYGTDDVKAAFAALDDADPAKRQAALVLLSRDLPRADISDLPTDELLALARNKLAGKKPSVVQRLPQTAYSKAVGELCVKLAADEAQMGVDKIDAAIRLPSAPQPTPDQALRDLAADLYSFGSPWETDSLDSDAARLKHVLAAHAGELARLLPMDDPQLDGTLAQAGLGQAKSTVASVIDMLRSALGTKAPTAENVKATVDGLNAEALEKLGQELDAELQRSMQSLQDVFTGQFASKLVNSATKSVDSMSLHEMAGLNAINPDQGSGKFLMNVLKNYFADTRIGLADRRRMLAAVLRSGATTPLGQIKELVKSAGPIFVKLLQGVPKDAVPPELHGLMDEIKSKMPPIPARVVKAQLWDLVKGSKGAVVGIDVVKSLGAASVAQTLLCRVRTKANPDGELCVIKIIRPDALNSARREKDFIHAMAELVGPGMKATVEGRTATILDELDLLVEAENVRQGKVYEDWESNVESMSLHPVLKATSHVMPLKLAPGVTASSYFGGLRERLKEILAPVSTVESHEIVTGGGTREVARYRTSSIGVYCAQFNRLRCLRHEAVARQRALLNLTHRWAQELLFGGGFMHGDLHGGNIMVDEQTATFIDYGNAIRLSKAQRESLIRLVALSVGGKATAGSFISELAAAVGKKLDENLRAEIGTVLANGSGNESGLRLAAVVSLLQNYDVKVPDYLYNFAQSMQRLQTAVEEANSAISEINMAISTFEYVPEQTKVGDKDVSVDGKIMPDLAKVVDCKDADDLTKAKKVAQDYYTAVKLTDDDLAARRSDILDKLLKLSQDGGRYSKEAIRQNILPEIRRLGEVMDLDVSEAEFKAFGPASGATALAIVNGLLDEKFDSDDPELVKAQLGSLAEACVQVWRDVTADYIKFQSLSVGACRSFAEVFQSAVDENMDAIQDAVRGGSALEALKVYKQRNKLAAIGTAAQEESDRIRGIQRENITFVRRNPDFDINLVQRLTDLVQRDFFFHPNSVDGISGIQEWMKEQDKVKVFVADITANVNRLKALLKNEFGAEPKDDFLKRALRLALDRFAYQHKEIANALKTASLNMSMDQLQDFGNNLSVDERNRRIKAMALKAQANEKEISRLKNELYGMCADPLAKYAVQYLCTGHDPDAK